MLVKPPDHKYGNDHWKFKFVLDVSLTRFRSLSGGPTVPNEREQTHQNAQDSKPQATTIKHGLFFSHETFFSAYTRRGGVSLICNTGQPARAELDMWWHCCWSLSVHQYRVVLLLLQYRLLQSQQQISLFLRLFSCRDLHAFCCESQFTPFVSLLICMLLTGI